MVDKIYHMKAPCKNCPFRKDTLKGWLGGERMTEILESDSFPCHKTTHGSVEDYKQCAGHMLMLGNASAYVRLAKALNQPPQLTGKELVFDTPEDCINHHSNRRSKTND